MECAEPPVERYAVATIIAFEVTMMKIVKVVARCRNFIFFLDDKVLEPRMTQRSHQPRELKLVDGVYRMSEQNPVQEHATKVYEMFDRMHR